MKTTAKKHRHNINQPEIIASFYDCGDNFPIPTYVNSSVLLHTEGGRHIENTWRVIELHLSSIPSEQFEC